MNMAGTKFLGLVQKLPEESDDREWGQKIYDEAKEATAEGKKVSIKLDLAKAPKSALQVFLSTGELTERQAALVAAAAGIDPLTAEIGSVEEFYLALSGLFQEYKENEENIDVFYAGRWYPAIATTQITRDFQSNSKMVQVNYVVSIHTVNGNPMQTVGGHSHLGRGMFIDIDSLEPIKRKFTDILKFMGQSWGAMPIRIRETNLDEMEVLRQQAEALRLGVGQVVDLDTMALYSANNWYGVSLVERHAQCQAIIEPTFEFDERRGHTHGLYGSRTDKTVELPFVRVFDMKRKEYCYVDVRDLTEHEWDKDALSKLVLPGAIGDVLRSIFETPNQDLFGDVLSHRGGGMAILATGSPGVGKTLTSEVYSNHTGRPLYVMEIGELGTNLEKIEENLRRIFDRAERWNLILLLDEADIFFAKRDLDIERSAIVGVFLRLLDYFKGMLFLTSNRPSVIDPAFGSRITLHLPYPALSAEARAKVWAILLEQAGISSSGNNEATGIALADLDLNGRQIRNVVRLGKAIYGNNVAAAQLAELGEFQVSGDAGVVHDYHRFDEAKA